MRIMQGRVHKCGDSNSKAIETDSALACSTNAADITNSSFEDEASTTPAPMHPSDADKATVGLKSALGKGGGKKAWVKVKMAQQVQGNMTSMVEDMREEAKRNMRLRMAVCTEGSAFPMGPRPLTAALAALLCQL